MSLAFLEAIDVEFPDGREVIVTVYVNGVEFDKKTDTVIANTAHLQTMWKSLMRKYRLTKNRAAAE